MPNLNNFPKLHNAAWPGVVGKGPDSEPPIELDTMLDLTAAAEVDGVKFDGFDLFLFDPHVSIDASDDEIKRLAEKAAQRNLVIGSVVAPVWEPTGGGSAMGNESERKKFLEQVRKGCRIARKLRDLGSRNRTYVNGELVTETLLCPGDIIRTGDRVLEYLDDSATPDRLADRKSTRLNSSHTDISRMPSSA